MKLRSLRIAALCLFALSSSATTKTSTHQRTSIHLVLTYLLVAPGRGGDPPTESELLFGTASVRNIASFGETVLGNGAPT